MSESNRELLDAFLADFASRRAAIEQRIAVNSEAVSVQTDLASLRKLLSDALAAGFVPSYDQRRLGDEIRELETSFQASQASSAKPRFAFKRKAGAPKSTPSPLPADGAVPNTPAPSDGLTIAHQTGTYITAVPRAGQDLTLLTLAGCVVDLRSAPALSAAHVRDVRDSVLLLPSLAGSALLQGLRNCLIVLQCQQFRMHDSEHIDVFLAPASHPVIEHCSSVRFGNLSPSAQELAFAPQDFSHVRDTPSPNWSFLSTQLDLGALDGLRDSGSELQDALIQAGVLPTKSSSEP